MNPGICNTASEILKIKARFPAATVITTPDKLNNKNFDLFSLRDGNNIPHVTISLVVGNNGLSIDQIKGKQNRHPIKKYANDVLSLLRHLQPLPERHADCRRDGNSL